MSEDGYTRITLRIPDALHARLTQEAANTSKSMNAEIVARLEKSFVGDGRQIEFTPDTMSLLLRSRLESQGAEPVGSSPEEFARRLRIEWDQNAKVVKLAGVRID